MGAKNFGGILPIVGRRSLGGGSRLPWVLWFLTLAAGAGIAFYGMENFRLQDQELNAAKDELAAIKGDVGRAEQEKLNLQSKLGRAEVNLKDNRQRFSQYAEEADDIKKKLAGVFGGDRSDVRVADDRIVLQIADSALFAEGSTKLSASGKKALDELGSMFVEMRERDIQVEAHTSDKPVSEVAKGFETNWEFAAARATAVVRHLHDEVGVDPDRLASVSFAEYRPISRTSPAKNRRIDIVLKPKSLQRVED